MSIINQYFMKMIILKSTFTFKKVIEKVTVVK